MAEGDDVERKQGGESWRKESGLREVEVASR